MLSDIQKLDEALKSNKFRLLKNKLQKVIQKYAFLAVSDDFDSQFFLQNIKKSKVMVVNQSKDLIQQTNDRYFIICFEETVIILKQSLLYIIDELFSINPNLTICYLNNTKEFFTKNYKEAPNINYFKDMILEIRSSIYVSPKEREINYLHIWKNLDECIYGYLIHKSYEKTRIDRIQLLKSDEYKPLKIVTISENDYIKIRLINSTFASSVDLIYHIEREELMVIKKSNQTDREWEKLRDREFENYKEIYYPLLPKKYSGNKKDDFLIIEYISGHTLDDIELNENEKMTIFFELIMIVEYLHRHNYIIRDIKPNNIIIDENKTAVLIDFDRMITNKDYLNTENHTTTFASFFAAPEVNLNNFSNKCDIYSLGKIIYYILEGNIYKNKEIERIYNECVKVNENERPKISELFVDFYVNFHSQIQIKNFTDIYQKQLKEIFDDYTIETLKNIEINPNSPETYNRLGVLYSEKKYVKVNDEKAFHYFSLAAEQKHKMGLFNVGYFYYMGRGVKKNIDQAIHYFSLASDLNEEKSQSLLGNIYCNNIDIGINIKKAIHFFTLAANNNFVDAQYNLGLIYLENKLIEMDINKSIKYFTLAANNNCVDALYNLGLIYLVYIPTETDINKSIKYFKLAADNNFVNAQYMLGCIYSMKLLSQETISQLPLFLLLMNNKLIAKIMKIYKLFPFDIDKAIHYYTLATEGNHELAPFMLGIIYSSNEFTKQDIKKSINYFSNSVIKYNNPGALCQLGFFYELGNGVKKYEKALDFYMKAANLNYPIAQCIVGYRYCEHLYLPKDIDKGIYYLTLAANKKVYQAQYYLGCVYYSEALGRFDIEKAIYYFTLASNQDVCEAYFYLGLIYYEGKYGIKRDIDKSNSYFQKCSNSNPRPEILCNLGIIYYLQKNYIYMNYFIKSANENNLKAQYILGLIYLLKLNNIQKIKKGIEYLTNCAEKYNSNACFLLGFFYHEGILIQQDISKAIEYYKKSLKVNSCSLNNLAIIYLNGFGDEIQPNLNSAIFYLNEAIEKGNDFVAMFNLANIYFFYSPNKDSIDNSIKLLIKIIDSEKNFPSYSKLLLSLILLKKYDFDIVTIKNEIKKFLMNCLWKYAN